MLAAAAGGGDDARDSNREFLLLLHHSHCHDGDDPLDHVGQPFRETHHADAR